MAEIKLQKDLSQESEGGQPIEAGEYHVKCTAVEEGTSQAGNVKADLQLTVQSGKYTGRVIFHTLAFTEKTGGMIKNCFKSFIGQESGDSVDPQKLINQDAIAKVSIQGERTDPTSGSVYPPKNRVQRFRALGS